MSVHNKIPSVSQTHVDHVTLPCPSGSQVLLAPILNVWKWLLWLIKSKEGKNACVCLTLEERVLPGPKPRSHSLATACTIIMYCIHISWCTWPCHTRY